MASVGKIVFAGFFLIIAFWIFGSSNKVFAACVPSYGWRAQKICQPSGCSSYSTPLGWDALFNSTCGPGGQTYTICSNCPTNAAARSCACGGGGGLTKPTCSILTNKTTYNAGDPINITINAGDNGEVYGGSSGVPAVAYPTLTGSGCGALVGFCPSTNLCTKKTSQGQCSNVCTSLRTTATNPTASSRTCTISFAVSNGPNKGAGSGKCSTTVTVLGISPKPNLTISSFSIPSGPPNSNQTATVRVTNSGSASTGSGFSVGVRTRGGSGTLGCNSNATVPVVSTSALPAGQSRNVPVSLTLPANPGTNITGGAMVDYGCVVNESNESDNKADDVYDVVSCDPNVIVSCGGWSSCSAACGAGTQSRSCTNQCEGTVMQSRACIIQTCCVPVSPAAPTLSSPPNGATNVGPSTNFSWSAPASWGNACPQPNNIGMYLTLKSSSGANILGPRLAKGLATTHAATLVCNTSYNWYVEASNGGSPFSSSSTFSFRTPTSIAGLTMNSAICTGGHCIFNWSTSPASPTNPSYTLFVNGIAECWGSANVCDIWWKTFPAGTTISWQLSGSNVCGSSTISGSVAVPCYGAFVTITNTDNSCSGKPGLGISGGFQMGSNDINSNQAYTINFSSGGSYDVIPATYSVSPTCTGEAGPANISCVDWLTYFQTFGGNVTAKGVLNDSKIPSGKFVSGNLTGQIGSAGLVAGTSVAPIPLGKGFFSQNGLASGWNIQFPQNPDLTKVQYENLLTAVLRYGGVSGVSEVCGAPGNKIDAPNGKAVTYECYGSSGNINMNSPGSNMLVLVPISNDPSRSIGAPGTLPKAGDKVVLFVDGELTVSSQGITLPNSTGLVVIGNSKISINPNATNVDGVFVADTIDTGNSQTQPLTGRGMLIGRSAVLLNRVINPSIGYSESWTYNPKYLDWFRDVFAKPTFQWTELSPI